jgi:hypothetical protein
MSFYKREGNTLSIAPNGVYARDFTLLASEYATYTLPVDGWHWFDTLKQAEAFFAIDDDEIDQLVIDILA